MKFTYRTLLLMLVVLVTLASCNTNDLKSLNVNPQAFDKMDPNYLFTAAQLGSASGGSSTDNRFIDWRMNIGFCGHMMQQLASTGPGGISPGDKYFNGEDGAWDILWSDVGKNVNDVIVQTGPKGAYEGKKVNTRQAARIVRAFNFQRLTDYYGSIPYTEAEKGLNGISTPKYDKQQTIYLDLLKELDEATAAISASNADEGFSKADLYFAGDITKWKKYGYSLMLRMAMRISDVDATTAGTYVSKAVAGGLMTDNGDNAWVKMAIGPSQWTNQNGISRAFLSSDGGQATNSFLAKTLIDNLKASSDPRLMIFSGGTNGDKTPANQIGLPNGLDQNTVKTYLGLPSNATVVLSNYFAIINPAMSDLDDPYMLMNAAESEFLLAEAIEKNIGTGIVGAASLHYNNGVKLAMQMYTPYDASLSVADASVDAFLLANPYAGTPAKKLEMIGNQMWLSKFFNWWEAWSDWRRTGFPVLTPVNYNGTLGVNVTGGKIPTKMVIPIIESQRNPNFQDGADPNQMTTKVWWDVN